MKEDICKDCVLLNSPSCTRIDGACFCEDLLNEHPIKRTTVDINKLQKLQEMLDKVLSEETPESLNKWLNEKIEEDYKLPIYRGWVEEHYHHYDWSDEEVLACNPAPSDNFIEGFIAALRYCNKI